MYGIYVIDKIKKGQEAIKKGKSISVESLKEEIKSWQLGQSLQNMI